MPEFTSDGDLPPGVHLVNWLELQAHFGAATSRRLWLFGRLQALIELAQSTGKLRRVFIWGSFVTTKAAPKDLDLLLIMEEDFDAARIGAAQVVFDAVSARLMFESDVFWARGSIGPEVLEIWLETYQIARDFRKRGIVELELS